MVSSLPPWLGFIAWALHTVHTQYPRSALTCLVVGWGRSAACCRGYCNTWQHAAGFVAAYRTVFLSCCNILRRRCNVLQHFAFTLVLHLQTTSCVSLQIVYMFRLPCCYVPLLLWLLGLCQWCTVGVLGTVPAPAALSYRLYVPPCAQGNHSQTLERWNNGLMSSPSERSFFSRVNAEWYWAHTFLADGTMKYLAHAVRTQRFVLVDTPAQADVCIGSCTEQCPPFLDHWLRFTVLAFPTCRREACCSVGLWTEWLPNEAAQNREPCTLLVPYMHSVHAGARPAPWESLAAARRPVLLTFVGSSYRGGRRAFLRQFEMAAKGSAHPNAFESPLLIHQHSDEEGLGWGHEPFYLRVRRPCALLRSCTVPEGLE